MGIFITVNYCSRYDPLLWTCYLAFSQRTKKGVSQAQINTVIVIQAIQLITEQQQQKHKCVSVQAESYRVQLKTCVRACVFVYNSFLFHSISFQNQTLYECFKDSFLFNRNGKKREYTNIFFPLLCLCKTRPAIQFQVVVYFKLNFISFTFFILFSSLLFSFVCRLCLFFLSITSYN